MLAARSCAALLLVTILRAQSPPAAEKLEAPTFEVASVKENKPGGRGSYTRSTPGRFASHNATLRNIIMSAYELIQNPQLIGGPKWMDSARFEIEAKAPGEADRPLIHRMLQALLAERFKLEAHRETKEMPVFFLVVAKNGPRLRDPRRDQGPPPANDPAIRSMRVLGSVVGLTHMLSNLLDRPVIDKTGITGSHDWPLELRREDVPEAAVFAALEEQLGLKLEAATAPVDVVVIDHVDKPSAN
jgi:uncharacterized protein (TIGR03435 family)